MYALHMHKFTHFENIPSSYYAAAKLILHFGDYSRKMIFTFDTFAISISSILYQIPFLDDICDNILFQCLLISIKSKQTHP